MIQRPLLLSSARGLSRMIVGPHRPAQLIIRGPLRQFRRVTRGFSSCIALPNRPTRLSSPSSSNAIATTELLRVSVPPAHPAHLIEPLQESPVHVRKDTLAEVGRSAAEDGTVRSL